MERFKYLKTLFLFKCFKNFSKHCGRIVESLNCSTARSPCHNGNRRDNRELNDRESRMTAHTRPGGCSRKHYVKSRLVKAVYNNLRAANPAGGAQLILRQNLSLVLNLSGLKAISLPSSNPS